MTLEQRKRKLIEYMNLKIAEQDWHALADAAMDMRELEVEIRMQKGTKITRKDLEELTFPKVN